MVWGLQNLFYTRGLEQNKWVVYGIHKFVNSENAISEIVK